MTFLRVISIFKKISKYEQNLNRFFVGINSKSSESNTQQNNITGKLDEQNNLETYQLRKDEFKSKTFIKELISNFRQNKYNRRYSVEFCNISWILFLTSPKCYKIIKQLIPLPSKSMLYNRFGKNLEKIKNELTNIEKMKDILNYYHSLAIKLTQDSQKKIIVSLAIDAFYFRSFHGTQTNLCKKDSCLVNESNDNEIMNNGFIFLIAPLTPKIPAKIVHIETRPNGSYCDQISEISKQITNIVQQYGFRVWFKATDGDSGMHSEHKNFFNIISKMKYTSFADLIHKIYKVVNENDEITIPIADPLHVFKNIRARLLNHTIAITMKNESEPALIDIKQIKSILNIGKALDDDSQIGKMRDTYALRLFTFGNLIKLIENGFYPAALLFFPYCCWIAAIYTPNIDLELRFFFIEIAFHLFYKMLSEIPLLLSKNISQRGKDTPVVFTEEIFVIRNINTLVAFGLAMIFG